ncbi:MAG: ATP-binding cassette domain-containing protein [Candidatus Bathyarchaeia archaeon]
MKVVEAKRLTFTYEGAENPSIRNVNLSIDEGEFTILTGPSGCGKTTLCRCLNGLIPHFYHGVLEGEISVMGLDVKSHSTKELAQHVGLVFQNPENQLFSLTVERELAFGPENLGLPRDETRKRVEWAMRKLNLQGIKDRPPYELSGGQQQKVAIASILTMQPKIIVLDEPTSFLDPKSAVELLSLISNLNKELDMTVILVEHRLDLASSYADRVIVMDEGEVAASGPPSEVYSQESRLRGVGVPKVSILFEQLRKAGIPVKENPTSVDEAYNYLRSVLDR